MRFEIRRLHDEFRITTVYVTHDQGEAMVTSDRIAVMNEGKIEQIDDPYALYNRPKTRFVAGFIGRTNFLEGRRAGNRLELDGFDLPATVVNGHTPADSGRVLLSVRPQSLTLLGTTPSAAEEALAVPVRVVESSYLGEQWEYVVAPERGDTRLRVTAPPRQRHTLGDRIWVHFDPEEIVALA
jgi:iron(III) transport system ATP-binding protein